MVTLVAPRNVNEVSNVRRIKHANHFAWEGSNW